MRASSTLASMLVLVAAVASGCASTKPEWVRARDDAENLRSAKYWCSKVTRDKFEKLHPDTTGRKKRVDLSEKCMNERGWRRSK